jgi:hypothetical protein
MSFVSEASKLLTNKYFLYFMVFLSATNVLGYLVTNKQNAVIFFALISLLTYQFSKNMAVILLVAVVATNFMMASKIMREGMTNDEESPALEKAAAVDPQIAATLPIVKNSTNNDEVKKKIESAAAAKDDSTKQAFTTNLSDNKNIDMNNTDLNKPVAEANIPEGVGEKLSGKKGQTSEHFGPRLDYAATIEQSYQNLDQLLGSDAIKQLSGDTQKLMSQQQNLFDTMNQMVPVLEGAQNMLKGFDISSLTSSLKGMSALGGAPIAVPPKK